MKQDPVAQMRANITGILQFHRLPLLEEISADVDRARYRGIPGFSEMVLRCRAFASWNLVSGHGPTAIRGWREERATCSMQIIEHYGNIFEMDIDHFNPGYGLGPKLLHLVEVFTPGKTDPFKIARALQKRGIYV